RTCADMNIAFAPDGTVYAVRLGYVGNDVGQIYIHRSSDGGRTWSGPTVVYDGQSEQMAFDRPWLLVDSTSGPRRGTVYVEAMTFFADPVTPHVYMKSSSDGGQTFTAAVQVDTAAQPAHTVAIPTWTIGPTGELIGVYRSIPSGCTRYCYTAATSADGGATFTVHPMPQPQMPDQLLDGNETNPYAVVAADPVHAGAFAALWGDASFSAGSEVDMAASSTTDDGATWSTPVQVNDGAANPGSLQDHQWLSYGANGTLYAA